MNSEGPTASRPSVIFIHGRGGPHRRILVHRWLTVAIERAGFVVEASDLGDLRAPTYYGQLHGMQSVAMPPARTGIWSGTPTDVDARSRVYDARLRTLEMDLTAFPYGTWKWVEPWIPAFLRQAIGEIGAWWLDEIDQYDKQETRRWSCWHAVLADWPGSTHVIVIAHSLGTVVAVELLPYLPPGTTIDLITLGSPLALPRFKDRLSTLRRNFPFEVIRSWVNLREPDDGPASMGPLSDAGLRLAVEHEVDLNGSHDAERYLRHPATGLVLARHLGLPTAT